MNIRASDAPAFAASPHTPQIVRFMEHCRQEAGESFIDDATFERWSIGNFRSFWRSLLHWSKIDFSGSDKDVCVGDHCETATFFPDVRLNYAQAVLAPGDGGAVAVTATRHGRPDEILTRQQLRRRVMLLAAHFERLGIQPGDRIVAVARNRIEVLVAALATAVVGATFSSCSHDMGVEAILARFETLDARILLAHTGSEPWDIGEPVRDRVCAVARRLPGLRHLVTLDPAQGLDVPVPVWAYDELLVGADDIPSARRIEQFGFNHPLFIMFSSGTTGRPKCIVHGAGGTLLEQVKEHRLHCDLGAGDRLYFHTGCAWMMWNWQLTALASGAEIVLFDGPLEGPRTLWDLVDRLAVTVFGTSPTYLQLCEQTGYRPGSEHELRALRSVLSTGSILYDRQFDWFEQNVKSVPLQSISGGTDILGCFVLGHPLRPVTRGEAPSRSLAMDVRSLAAPEGESAGELVCVNPFPSRPLGFFGDDGSAFHRAYFSQNPPYWTHGDLIEFTSCGGARLHGRSDDVMNIKGIRIGPAEIYAILKRIHWITGAMAVERRGSGNDRCQLVLLVVLEPGLALDEERRGLIRERLVEEGSTAFVPALCVQVEELPETISGKRSEASVRNLVNGRPVRNAGSLRNPECLRSIEDAIDAADARHEIASDEPNNPLIERIQQLLSQALRAELGSDDNFLAAGVDSLAIVHILLRLERLSGHKLSIADIVHVPTARGIAHRIAGGTPPTERSTMAQVQGLSTSIRRATADDVAEICAFLSRGFGNTISSTGWRSLMATRWTEEDYGYGFVLVSGTRIVGFIGTIYSNHRGSDGKISLICNLTSWYVEPLYRSAGVQLLTMAVQSTDASYTSLTPASGVERILKGVGFRAYDRLDFFGPHLVPKGGFVPECRIEFQREKIRERASDEQRYMLDTHQHQSLLHFIVDDEFGHCYAVAKRRKMPWRGIPVVVSEIVYADRIDVIHRRFGTVRNRLLLKQRALLLTMESRLSPADAKPLKRSNSFRYIYNRNGEGTVAQSIFSELSLLDV